MCAEPAAFADARGLDDERACAGRGAFCKSVVVVGEVAAGADHCFVAEFEQLVHIEDGVAVNIHTRADDDPGPVARGEERDAVVEHRAFSQRDAVGPVRPLDAAHPHFPGDMHPGDPEHRLPNAGLDRLPELASAINEHD